MIKSGLITTNRSRYDPLKSIRVQLWGYWQYSQRRWCCCYIKGLQNRILFNYRYILATIGLVAAG